MKHTHTLLVALALALVLGSAGCNTKREKDEERAIYVPVEPTDPFTEAIRTAQEIGAEVLFFTLELNA